MRRPNNQIIKTTFGTELTPINLNEGVFVLTNDSIVILDTPIQDDVGTKKTFIKGSVQNGTLWKESDPRAGKTRKVVMVQDGSGRYLIPAKDLTPTTQAEQDAQAAKSEVEKLGNKVKELLSDAKDEAKEIIEDPKNFLEKEYVGFKGKQILVATVGVIVLIKIFK